MGTHSSPPAHSYVDLHVELRHVAAEFASAVGALRPAGTEPGVGTNTHVDPGITPANLSLVLPFHLIEAFPFEGDVDAARVMSLANAFGAAHFLAQDKMLDGEEPPSPRGSAFSDVCLARFVREYVSISGGVLRLWTCLDTYVREYFESLAWERDVLWGETGDSAIDEAALEDTLDALGRKMSPLKISVAAVSLLADAPELLESGERVVEAYHSGYQLLDDLADLSADAVRGRWSVPLRMLQSRGALDAPAGELTQPELMDATVGSGVFDEISDLVCRRYGLALDEATRLGLRSLAEYLERSLGEATATREWTARRARVADVDHASRDGAGAQRRSGSDVPRTSTLSVAPNVHAFNVGSRRFVVDPASCLFFEADDVAVDALSWIRRGSVPSARRVLELNHGADAFVEALDELSVLGPWENEHDGGLPKGRVAGQPSARLERSLAVSLRNIVSLALNVTSACNLACDYCYLRGASPERPASMTEETALAAVELLLEEAACDGEASLVFFGGEPLLEAEFVFRVATRAREKASARGVKLALHVTTNGTMLTPSVARRLHELRVTVLVSMDGPAKVQDAHRRFSDGTGSHEAVARNLRGLPPGMPVSARVTVTPDSAGFVETVAHLTGLGFSAVHLSPASGDNMSQGFARKLEAELETLARSELDSILRGSRPVVGNFARAMKALAAGRPRSAPCGAGLRYLCVDPDGRFFLCHRFAGDGAFEVGSVTRGVDRRAVRGAVGALRGGSAACEACWARFLCGGPCLHDLSVGGGRVDDARCRVTRRGFELAMWMYASLSGDAKRGLVSAAAAACEWEGG